MSHAQPIGTDDAGRNLYACHYTGAKVAEDEAVWIGAIVPGVKARYAIADTAEARAAHKASGRTFAESEANCNTCVHLRRETRTKQRDGFLYGTCASPRAQPEASPYHKRQQGAVMVFHPDDPMHMPCYVSRWAAAKEVL